MLIGGNNTDTYGSFSLSVCDYKEETSYYDEVIGESRIAVKYAQKLAGKGVKFVEAHKVLNANNNCIYYEKMKENTGVVSRLFSYAKALFLKN